MTGTVFHIQRTSFADGPGIRTTVFFKGCNLRCAWCHNPESQSACRELLLHREKCTGCGRCKAVCPRGEAACTACGRCAEACRSDARELSGREMTPEQVLQELQKDRIFYQSSGGGVTFSGGECMLQIDFLETLLLCCREAGIPTAVDTAGHLPWEYFARILPLTDLFLYDLKAMDPEVHRRWTGVDNGLILGNLARLLEQKVPLWVRVPMVAGIQDTEQEMAAIRAFYQAHCWPEKTELLPYHALGEEKYRALGKETPRFSPPEADRLAALSALLVP